MRSAAYCTATSFDTNGLLTYLKSQYSVTRYREVMHVQVKPGSESDVFFFPYGAVVFWGLDEHLERDVLTAIRRFEYQHVDPVEDDVFTYEYAESGNTPGSSSGSSSGSSQAKIEEDEITLPDRDVVTKLAFSHAMAQSVKLAVFEQTIQKTIHLTRELPELLAHQGNIQLSRRDIRKMMGRLFIDRSSINLHQELLDTPEFFWERSDLEPYYAQMAHYLDRERRVHVLNQRLVILQELFDMLAAELNHQHSSRLEWTIIVLIVIEVMLTVARDILRIL